MVPRRCILMTLASPRIILWHYHVQSDHESFVCKLIRKLLSFSLDLLPHLVNYGPIQSEMDNKAGYALWHFYLERLTPHRDLGMVFQLLSKYGSLRWWQPIGQYWGFKMVVQTPMGDVTVGLSNTLVYDQMTIPYILSSWKHEQCYFL